MSGISSPRPPSRSPSPTHQTAFATKIDSAHTQLKKSTPAFIQHLKKLTALEEQAPELESKAKALEAEVSALKRDLNGKLRKAISSFKQHLKAPTYEGMWHIIHLLTEEEHPLHAVFMEYPSLTINSINSLYEVSQTKSIFENLNQAMESFLTGEKSPLEVQKIELKIGESFSALDALFQARERVGDGKKSSDVYEQIYLKNLRSLIKPNRAAERDTGSLTPELEGLRELVKLDPETPSTSRALTPLEDTCSDETSLCNGLKNLRLEIPSAGGESTPPALLLVDTCFREIELAKRWNARFKALKLSNPSDLRGERMLRTQTKYMEVITSECGNFVQKSKENLERLISYVVEQEKQKDAEEKPLLRHCLWLEIKEFSTWEEVTQNIAEELDKFAGELQKDLLNWLQKRSEYDVLSTCPIYDLGEFFFFPTAEAFKALPKDDRFHSIKHTLFSDVLAIAKEIVDPPKEKILLTEQAEEIQIQLKNLLWHPDVLEYFFLIVLAFLYVENVYKEEKIGTREQIDTVHSALAILSSKRLTQVVSRLLIRYLEKIKSYKYPFKESLKEANLPTQLSDILCEIAEHFLELQRIIQSQESIKWETVEAITEKLQLAYKRYQDIYSRFEKQKRNLSERQQHMTQNISVEKRSVSPEVKIPPEDQAEAIEQDVKAKLETFKKWLLNTKLIDLPETNEVEVDFNSVRNFIIDDKGCKSFASKLSGSMPKGEAPKTARAIQKIFNAASDYSSFLKNAVDKPEEFQKLCDLLEKLPKNSKRQTSK